MPQSILPPWMLSSPHQIGNGCLSSGIAGRCEAAQGNAANGLPFELCDGRNDFSRYQALWVFDSLRDARLSRGEGTRLGPFFAAGHFFVVFLVRVHIPEIMLTAQDVLHGQHRG